MSKIAALFLNFDFFDLDSCESNKDILYNFAANFYRQTKSKNQVEEIKQQLFSSCDNKRLFYKVKELELKGQCEKIKNKICNFINMNSIVHTNLDKSNFHYIKSDISAKGKKGRGSRLLSILYEDYSISFDKNKTNGINSTLEDEHLEVEQAQVIFYVFSIE